jgi:hypothetical protein
VDAHFVDSREVEITLPTPYTKDLPIKINQLGLLDKKHYRTGDLCRLLGVKADTLRWRFRTGEYPEVTSDGKGRLFALADIERILAITQGLPKCRSPRYGQPHGAKAPP